MKEKLSATNQKTMRIVFIFLFVVVALISLSLCIRGIMVYRLNTFDGDHRYIMKIVDPAKKVTFFSIEPLSRSVAVVEIKGSYKISDIDSLPVFTDVTVNTVRVLNTNESVGKTLQRTLLENVTTSSMTVFDSLRLYAVLYLIPKDGFSKQTVSLPLSSTPLLVFKKNFVDNEIVRDNKTYAIVNATGISGLAGRLEQVIAIMGGRAVSVTTDRDEKKETQITYFGKKSYSVRRIEKILHKNAVQSERGGVSDILIVLGKESLGNKLFQQ
jgi:hypothetical protein